MTEQLVETLREIGEALADAGCRVPGVSPALQDQAQTAFRANLAANGVTPSTKEEMAAAIVGFTAAMRPMVQQGLPIVFIAMFVGLCECLVPMIDAPIVDPAEVGDLPDLDFLNAFQVETEPEAPLCMNCHQNPAVARLPNGSLWCQSCVERGMNLARTMVRGAMPQVGGPTFNRGPDPVADVGPKRFWDLTVVELFSKLRRRKHGKS